MALLLVSSAILPFLFGVDSLSDAGPYSKVSLPVTVAQAALTLGLVCVRPELGWMRLLSGDAPASREMRSLAIGVIALPLGLAILLQTGLHARLYPSTYDVPVLVFGSIIVVFAALLMTAARLRRIDLERQRSTEARERAESELGIALAAAKMVGFQLDLRTGALRRYTNGAGSSHTSHEAYLSTVHPSDRDRVGQYLQRQCESRRSEYQLHYRVLDAKQAVHWILEKGEIRYGEHGEAQEIVGVTIDITQDVQVREALRESEDRFRRLAESMPQIAYISGAQGDVVYVNQRWREYTGHATASDADYRKLLPPEDFARLSEAWTVAIEKGEPLTAEFRLRGADGVYRWFLTRAIPVRNSEGAIDCWYGTSTDIDAQKRAHEELRLVTDHADVVLAHCDSEARYLFVNQAYSVRFGCKPQDVIGKRIADVIGAAAYRVVEPYVEQVLAGQPVTFEVEIPYRQIGSRYMLCRYVPDIDVSSGKVRGFVAALSDVSERRELEEQLREADHRKDEFLALLAHELRNPLAPIRYATGLLKPGVPKEISAAAHDVIERQVAHMARLVDDLLDVSRITRNTLELRVERVDLRAIVNSAVDTVRPLFEAVNHKLHVSLPAEPTYVQGDSTRLLQIVGNLLNNAAKYTEPGGRIELNVAREGRQFVLNVRDTGIGIAPELLPKLFELFVQGDRTQARASSGLGVGLSLAKRLVELHEGSIEAYSDGPGAGSVFTVKLPAAVEAVPTESRALAENVLPMFQRRHQLLIVDDNLDAANSLAILAQFSGYVTHIANDGLAAIEMAELVRPEAIIMDLGMPRMSGFEAARWVRQQPWGKDTVLIAVTGWGQDEDRRKSREAGFDVHLTKPVDSAELLNELQSREIGAPVQDSVARSRH
jgi:PAS domain S-box-containing protein